MIEVHPLVIVVLTTCAFALGMVAGIGLLSFVIGLSDKSK